MRKIVSLVLTLVFVFSASLPVLADGISDEQRGNYPNVMDYRNMDISDNPNHQRPKAGFSLQTKSGERLSGEVLSGAWNTDKNIISSSQDSLIIHARVGDRIVINNCSTLGSGSVINKFDIQYRFTPKGKNRQDYTIHPAIVGNFNEVKNIIERLPLSEPGTYEIFLCVADNAQCLPGATNWSANGNLRSINTNNIHFPNGMFWYFTEALIEVKEGELLPDFFVTVKPKTTYPGPYAGAKQGYAGEKVLIEARVGNIGEVAATTDFGASWWGSGWQKDKIVYYKDNIYLEPGQIVDVPFEVTVPRQGEETRLILLTNIDLMVPELNYNNNNF